MGDSLTEGAGTLRDLALSGSIVGLLRGECLPDLTKFFHLFVIVLGSWIRLQRSPISFFVNNGLRNVLLWFRAFGDEMLDFLSIAISGEF